MKYHCDECQADFDILGKTISIVPVQGGYAARVKNICPRCKAIYTKRKKKEEK